MTTEDDFQRTLDANPNDWQTRLVFADWLEEHGDPRAEGYRAIAAHADVRFFPQSKFGGWRVCGAYRWSENFECATRREAENAAALAFAQLPTERRAELLIEAKTACENDAKE